MTKKGYDTGTEGTVDTAEGPRGEEKRVRIRSTTTEGRWRNNRHFGFAPEVFTAEELGWTPEQWEKIRKDPYIVVEDVK